MNVDFFNEFLFKVEERTEPERSVTIEEPEPMEKGEKKSKSGFKKGAKAVGKALKLTKSSKKADKLEKSPKGK